MIGAHNGLVNLPRPGWGVAVVDHDSAKDDADDAILVVFGDQGAAIGSSQPAADLALQIAPGLGLHAPEIGIGRLDPVLKRQQQLDQAIKIGCLRGPEGVRSVPASQFFLGPGRTALLPSEFMTAVRFPPQPAGSAASYQKLGRCRAGDLALVGVAALGSPDASNPSGYSFRIALGSVAPTPIRALRAEALLASRAPDTESFSLAAREAQSHAAPITDVRGTAEYQLAMVHTLATRALATVWASLKEGE